uniref:RING-type domain-containing protein n=1 Tax=Macrostomum lignano TaxID=282301 RepID=A0A1I8HHC1_9PLAT
IFRIPYEDSGAGAIAARTMENQQKQQPEQKQSREEACGDAAPVPPSQFLQRRRAGRAAVAAAFGEDRPPGGAEKARQPLPAGMMSVMGRPVQLARRMSTVEMVVHNEEGETEEVEIDVADVETEAGSQRSGSSISDRISRRRNSELAADIIRLSAAHRRREFVQLLNEHRAIVHQLQTTGVASDSRRSNQRPPSLAGVIQEGSVEEKDKENWGQAGQVRRQYKEAPIAKVAQLHGAAEVDQQQLQRRSGSPVGDQADPVGLQSESVAAKTQQAGPAGRLWPAQLDANVQLQQLPGRLAQAGKLPAKLVRPRMDEFVRASRTDETGRRRWIDWRRTRLSGRAVGQTQQLLAGVHSASRPADGLQSGRVDGHPVQRAAAWPAAAAEPDNRRHGQAVPSQRQPELAAGSAGEKTGQAGGRSRGGRGSDFRPDSATIASRKQADNADIHKEEAHLSDWLVRPARQHLAAAPRRGTSWIADHAQVAGAQGAELIHCCSRQGEIAGSHKLNRAPRLRIWVTEANRSGLVNFFISGKFAFSFTFSLEFKLGFGTRVEDSPLAEAPVLGYVQLLQLRLDDLFLLRIELFRFRLIQGVQHCVCFCIFLALQFIKVGLLLSFNFVYSGFHRGLLFGQVGQGFRFSLGQRQPGLKFGSPGGFVLVDGRGQSPAKTVGRFRPRRRQQAEKQARHAAIRLSGPLHGLHRGGETIWTLRIQSGVGIGVWQVASRYSGWQVVGKQARNIAEIRLLCTVQPGLAAVGAARTGEGEQRQDRLNTVRQQKELNQRRRRITQARLLVEGRQRECRSEAASGGASLTSLAGAGRIRDSGAATADQPMALADETLAHKSARPGAIMPGQTGRTVGVMVPANRWTVGAAIRSRNFGQTLGQFNGSTGVCIQLDSQTGQAPLIESATEAAAATAAAEASAEAATAFGGRRGLTADRRTRHGGGSAAEDDDSTRCTSKFCPTRDAGSGSSTARQGTELAGAV